MLAYRRPFPISEPVRLYASLCSHLPEDRKLVPLHAGLENAPPFIDVRVVRGRHAGVAQVSVI